MARAITRSIRATPTASAFRASWLRGSNRLHTRLWHNRLARQTLLTQPATGGTPGAANSRAARQTSAQSSTHWSIPRWFLAASQPATVSIKIADHDGVSDVQLFTSINGAAFTSSAMTSTGGGVYSGTVPGQSGGAARAVLCPCDGFARGSLVLPARGPGLPRDDSSGRTAGLGSSSQAAPGRTTSGSFCRGPTPRNCTSSRI